MKAILVISTFCLLVSVNTSASDQVDRDLHKVCYGFKDDVQRYAREYQSSNAETTLTRKMVLDSREDADQLAYILVNSYNMTPHNAAYVAEGLCKFQFYEND